MTMLYQGIEGVLENIDCLMPVTHRTLGFSVKISSSILCIICLTVEIYWVNSYRYRYIKYDCIQFLAQYEISTECVYKHHIENINKFSENIYDRHI